MKRCIDVVMLYVCNVQYMYSVHVVAVHISRAMHGIIHICNDMCNQDGDKKVQFVLTYSIGTANMKYMLCRGDI
jgi:hypothetical protein